MIVIKTSRIFISSGNKIIENTECLANQEKQFKSSTFHSGAPM